jgi:hypothetical protein
MTDLGLWGQPSDWGVVGRKPWFFRDYSGTTSGIPRMQGTRRATGPAPLREGGVAAMNGRPMHGKRQAAGAATGGVLRSAVAPITTFHRQQKNQSLCGWTTQKPASTATRSTPPAALSFRATLAIHKPSSSGRHPPLGRGRMLAHSPFSRYLSTISRQSFPPTIIPEEPKHCDWSGSKKVWLQAVVSAATSTADAQKRVPPRGERPGRVALPRDLVVEKRLGCHRQT